MSMFVENPCERVTLGRAAATAIHPPVGALVLAAAILASGMALLDATAVNAILPR